MKFIHIAQLQEILEKIDLIQGKPILNKPIPQDEVIPGPCGFTAVDPAQQTLNLCTEIIRNQHTLNDRLD